ncbi:glutamine amidotransferase-like uncharacterized protein [Vogesella perlucida]|nr:glutamine amidotransferase-like uncharacterized protein [Vogesella perlucida]
MTRYLILLTGLLALPALAANVVIFRGAGTCDGCPEAVGKLLQHQHHRVSYVDEHTLSAQRLRGATLYVQPGGSDDIDETLQALQPAQVQALRRFVANGGHYLGICAGAYLAARYSDRAAATPAFGLLAIDELHAEVADPAPSLLPMRWGKQVRRVYNQSGPHMGTTPPAGASVLARYQASGRIAALGSRYGKGRLLLIGPHFEADADWYRSDGLTLQYGLNTDLFYRALAWLPLPAAAR